MRFDIVLMRFDFVCLMDSDTSLDHSSDSI